MLILPQFHVAGFMGISSYGLLNGLELHNVTKFNPNTFLQFIKERKVIIISAFNTLFQYFAQNCFTNTVFFINSSSFQVDASPLGSFHLEFRSLSAGIQ